MKAIFMSAFMIIGCSTCGLFEKKDNEPKKTKTPYEELAAKSDNYRQWSKALEEGGVINPRDCDGLLWNALYQVATGRGSVSEWQGKPGQWFRRPSHDCLIYKDGEWVDNDSKTSISRDMFLGLFLWLWDRQDLEAVENLIVWGRAANPQWFMGEAINIFEREGATHLRPPILGTLFELAYQLGGEDNTFRKFPYSVSTGGSGYQLHLAVLHTLIRGQIIGGISDTELGGLKKISKKQPKNPFYSAVYHYFKDGDQSAAIAMLLDEEIWPSDRLPGSQDRCSAYILQRDYDRGEEDGDWAPCPKEGHIFAGIGLMITFKVISNTLVDTEHRL